MVQVLSHFLVGFVVCFLLNRQTLLEVIRRKLKVEMWHIYSCWP